PEAVGVTVGGLIPARSYQFRLCAVNDVGRGQFSKETDRLSLPEEPPSAPPQTVIASGRTNQSIMIQWQPPPESHQNGPLQGYIIRYCLSGLPVDCQMKNLTNPDQTTLLLEDLINLDQLRDRGGCLQRRRPGGVQPQGHGVGPCKECPVAGNKTGTPSAP
ncbi:unnamed protein product, partial [Gadus morhua 'NCC']